MEEWPQGEVRTLEGLQGLARKTLPGTHVETGIAGGLAVVSWENGPPLSVLRAAFEDLPGIEWRQLDQTQAYATIRQDGIPAHQHPTLLVRREVSHLAYAYAQMAIDLVNPCQCTDAQTYPPEVYELYNSYLNQPGAENVETHPSLLATGIDPLELQRMGELLAVLTTDTAGEADEEVVYCRVGHLEGLRELARTQ